MITAPTWDKRGLHGNEQNLHTHPYPDDRPVDGQLKKVTTKVQGFRESEAHISFKEKVMAMWGGPFPWPHGNGSQAVMHGAQSSVKRLLFKALC